MMGMSVRPSGSLSVRQDHAAFTVGVDGLQFSRFMVVITVITSLEFHGNPISILAKRIKYIWHRTEDGTDGQTEAATDKTQT